MNVTLKNCRFSYLNVLTPREQKNDNGDPTYRYSANLLVPKDSPDHKALVAAIEAVAVGQWANKAQGVLAKLYAENRVCLKDGDKELDNNGEIRQGYAGMMSLRSAVSIPEDTAEADFAKFAPRVFNKFGDKITNENKHEFTGDRCGPYSGAYGEAMVRLWAQDSANPTYGRRINCQLIAIKMSAPGESLARKEMSDDEILSQFSVETRKEVALEDMAS